jgi:hypothetical protein
LSAAVTAASISMPPAAALTIFCSIVVLMVA